MERPNIEQEDIARQNDRYARLINEIYEGQPKTAEILVDAIQEAFVYGAGGPDGSDDAWTVLYYGGTEALIDSLGLTDIIRETDTHVEQETFERAVRVAVDYGVEWDTLEDEISDEQRNRAERKMGNPFERPDSVRFLHRVEDYWPGEA